MDDFLAWPFLTFDGVLFCLFGALYVVIAVFTVLDWIAQKKDKTDG